MIMRFSPMRSSCTKEHSILTGDSLIRGALIERLGISVRFVRAISETSSGYSSALATICGAVDSSTRLTTNSLVSRMFRAVSLGIPGDLLPGAKATIGGRLPITLKKENGAILLLPDRLLVLTQAIGRGTTKAVKTL